LRYYQEEHESTYRDISQRGHDQWNDAFEPGRWTYENFQNREFLEDVLAKIEPDSYTDFKVLEYGCGTGPAACFLAAAGLSVDAIDIVPDAIAIAKSKATSRNLHVNFSVADICVSDLQDLASAYDMILDTYCLQSIVLDDDRAAVVSAVRDRLKPDGYYVISTSLQKPHREISAGHFFDVQTDILYRTLPEGFMTDNVIDVDGMQMIPQRRHRTADGLRKELVENGFVVIDLGNNEAGDFVCRLKSSEV
jgi:2-polyprenyl-3-methyl-5-hydroxy-6-metoxy-1,4-benzoquinol methylase